MRGEGIVLHLLDIEQRNRRMLVEARSISTPGDIPYLGHTVENVQRTCRKPPSFDDASRPSTGHAKAIDWSHH